jgi:hypothetical protein
LIDAALAARRLLSGEPTEPSSRRSSARGPAPALARARGAMQARTAALNLAHALLVTAPDQMRGPGYGSSDSR